MSSIAAAATAAEATRLAQAQPVAPIQAKLHELECCVAVLGDNVRKLAEQLGPVRLYSPETDERGAKGLVPVPNMSTIESSIVQISSAAAEINAMVTTLQNEVRL